MNDKIKHSELTPKGLSKLTLAYGIPKKVEYEPSLDFCPKTNPCCIFTRGSTLGTVLHT